MLVFLVALSCWNSRRTFRYTYFAGTRNDGRTWSGFPWPPWTIESVETTRACAWGRGQRSGIATSSRDLLCGPLLRRPIVSPNILEKSTR